MSFLTIAGLAVLAYIVAAIYLAVKKFKAKRYSIGLSIVAIAIILPVIAYLVLIYFITNM